MLARTQLFLKEFVIKYSGINHYIHLVFQEKTNEKKIFTYAGTGHCIIGVSSRTSASKTTLCVSTISICSTWSPGTALIHICQVKLQTHQVMFMFTCYKAKPPKQNQESNSSVTPLPKLQIESPLINPNRIVFFQILPDIL